MVVKVLNETIFFSLANYKFYLNNIKHKNRKNEDQVLF